MRSLFPKTRKLIPKKSVTPAIISVNDKAWNRDQLMNDKNPATDKLVIDLTSSGAVDHPIQSKIIQYINTGIHDVPDSRKNMLREVLKYDYFINKYNHVNLKIDDINDVYEYNSDFSEKYVDNIPEDEEEAEATAGAESDVTSLNGWLVHTMGIKLDVSPHIALLTDSLNDVVIQTYSDMTDKLRYNLTNIRELYPMQPRDNIEVQLNKDLFYYENLDENAIMTNIKHKYYKQVQEYDAIMYYIKNPVTRQELIDLIHTAYAKAIPAKLANTGANIIKTLCVDTTVGIAQQFAELIDTGDVGTNFKKRVDFITPTKSFIEILEQLRNQLLAAIHNNTSLSENKIDDIKTHRIIDKILYKAYNLFYLKDHDPIRRIFLAGEFERDRELQYLKYQKNILLLEKHIKDAKYYDLKLYTLKTFHSYLNVMIERSVKFGEIVYPPLSTVRPFGSRSGVDTEIAKIEAAITETLAKYNRIKKMTINIDTGFELILAGGKKTRNKRIYKRRTRKA